VDAKCYSVDLLVFVIVFHNLLTIPFSRKDFTLFSHLNFVKHPPHSLLFSLTTLSHTDLHYLLLLRNLIYHLSALFTMFFSSLLETEVDPPLFILTAIQSLCVLNQSSFTYSVSLWQFNLSPSPSLLPSHFFTHSLNIFSPFHSIICCKTQVQSFISC
jgi:hypothetical protein